VIHRSTRHLVSARSALTALMACAALVAAGAVAGSPGPATTDAKRGKIWTWDFAADTLGQAPPLTTVMGGAWSVVADSASSSGRTLRQTEDDDGVAFHYLRWKRPLLGDVVASVRFRIVSGEIDPTAGLMFQLDPKGTSGYLVRVSSRTGELSFHYLLFGKRRDVRFAKIEPPQPGTWHTLSIRREGSILRASYDGAERMLVRDERNRKGTIGLWTEDDTVVDFADLSAGVP
jgi:hypothetical protein